MANRLPSGMLRPRSHPRPVATCSPGTAACALSMAAVPPIACSHTTSENGTLSGTTTTPTSPRCAGSITTSWSTGAASRSTPTRQAGDAAFIHPTDLDRTHRSEPSRRRPAPTPSSTVLPIDERSDVRATNHIFSADVGARPGAAIARPACVAACASACSGSREASQPSANPQAKASPAPFVSMISGTDGAGTAWN